MISSSLKKVVRSEAIEAERIRKLTPKQLDIIYENKWFHLLVPRDYGGVEMSLPEFATFIEELAIVDGSFAWNVNLGAGANMFSGYMDSETAKLIFSNPKTCIAGSGAISGTAERRGNQFYIQGLWKYASGSAHANFFSLNARLIADEGHGDVSSFIVPREEVEILDTWNSTGLKATASHDFKVEGYSVPNSFSFDLLKPSPNCKGTLYRFPFQLLAEINMLVMSTGLAKRFLELVREVSRHKSTKVGGVYMFDLLEFQELIKEYEHSFLKARNDVFESLLFLWNKVNVGDKISSDEQDSFTKQILLAAVSSRHLVDAFYPFMGMDTVFESSEINRVWRDFKTASQHALISPVRLVNL